MGKYILVDTENVNFECLSGIEELSCEDRVFLFLSQRSKKHYSNKKINSISTLASIQQINVSSGSKNSLDFQLVSFLGMLIGEHKHLKSSNDYYIVSKDRGFLSSINLLNGYTNRFNIDLVSKLNIMVNIDKLSKREMLYDELVEIFKPKTVKKIFSAIDDCDDLMDIEMKLLKVFNNKSVYKQCECIFKKYYNEIKVVA